MHAILDPSLVVLLDGHWLGLELDATEDAVVFVKVEFFHFGQVHPRGLHLVFFLLLVGDANLDSLEQFVVILHVLLGHGHRVLRGGLDRTLRVRHGKEN